MAKDNKDQKKTKLPTAEKRQIQDNKKRDRNRAFKAQLRTAVRRFKENVAGEEAQTHLKKVYSLLDKAVKKGIFKLNKASRLKSRLTALSKAAA